ncbi:MAG TPA: lysozyme inhibitor LprI family protein [Acidobacteriaceae bacterium]|nr:lysozyme inhibitor LprI family protein [Acidobacteriaceae bacterium]
MNPKDRIGLIEKSKSIHGKNRVYGGYELETLCGDYLKQQKDLDFVPDIYPVRAVSILEVFTRGWVTRVANHSPTFAERAIPAVQNFKPDYSLLLSISGKSITFGDIVGFAISVNRLDQIISIFSTLCGKDIVPLLKTAVDRRETEIHGKPEQPIIASYDATAASISALFEIRHAICHEAPSHRDLDFIKLGEMLDSAVDFAKALTEILVLELYGRVPLTQAGMNQAAYEEYKVAEEKLNAVLENLREQYKEHPRRLKLLNTSQRVWERYIRLQALFRHDPVGGGTIGPLLHAREMESLTDERRQRLEKYVDNEYL